MKDKFYNLLDQLISTNHFLKVDENKFELKQLFSQPGPVMNINGKVIKGQDKTIELIKGIIIQGDGYCSNIDDTHKQEFAQINFFITQNNEYNVNVDICFYYDDQQYLKDIFDKIMQ